MFNRKPHQQNGLCEDRVLGLEDKIMGLDFSLKKKELKELINGT